MRTFNMHEAKTNFAKLITLVQHGEEVIIAKAGIPAAKLSPLKPMIKRQPGLLKGKIKISPTFDEPMPQEILDAFKCQ